MHIHRINLEQISELVTALSNFAWPIFAAGFVWTFKAEIRHLFERLKRAKLFGNEVELDKDIRELQEAVQEAEKEIPGAILSDEQYKLNNQVLSDASRDPRLAIIQLAAEIEKTIREIVSSMGLLENKSFLGVRQSIQLLEHRGALPAHVVGAVQIFFDIRNKLAHGKSIDENQNILSVLDTGITLLNTLRSIPHETHVVDSVGVKLYADESCTKERTDVTGIILETNSPSGLVHTHRIFPTTKSTYYVVGKQVAWEWNLSHTWDETWYIHPKTKEKIRAWLGAGEFVGRHLEDV